MERFVEPYLNSAAGAHNYSDSLYFDRKTVQEDDHEGDQVNAVVFNRDNCLDVEKTLRYRTKQASANWANLTEGQKNEKAMCWAASLFVMKETFNLGPNGKVAFRSDLVIEHRDAKYINAGLDDPPDEFAVVRGIIGAKLLLKSELGPAFRNLYADAIIISAIYRTIKGVGSFIGTDLYPAQYAAHFNFIPVGTFTVDMSFMINKVTGDMFEMLSTDTLREVTPLITHNCPFMRDLEAKGYPLASDIMSTIAMNRFPANFKKYSDSIISIVSNAVRKMGRNGVDITDFQLMILAFEEDYKKICMFDTPELKEWWNNIIIMSDRVRIQGPELAHGDEALRDAGLQYTAWCYRHVEPQTPNYLKRMDVYTNEDSLIASIKAVVSFGEDKDNPDTYSFVVMPHTINGHEFGKMCFK